MSDRSSVQYIQRRIQDLRQEADVYERFLPEIAVCSQLDDIAEIRYLLNYTPRWVSMEYRGKAHNEEEARADLARIMQTLGILFSDIQLYGQYGTERPHGRYTADTTWQGEPMKIYLDVAWLPVGCSVSYHKQTSYTRAPGRGYWSASCKR